MLTTLFEKLGYGAVSNLSWAGWVTVKRDNLFFFFLTFIQSFIIQLQKKSPSFGELNEME